MYVNTLKNGHTNCMLRQYMSANIYKCIYFKSFCKTYIQTYNYRHALSYNSELRIYVCRLAVWKCSSNYCKSSTHPVDAAAVYRYWHVGKETYICMCLCNCIHIHTFIFAFPLNSCFILFFCCFCSCGLSFGACKSSCTCRCQKMFDLISLASIPRHIYSYIHVFRNVYTYIRTLHHSVTNSIACNWIYFAFLSFCEDHKPEPNRNLILKPHIGCHLQLKRQMYTLLLLAAPRVWPLAAPTAINFSHGCCYKRRGNSLLKYNIWLPCFA